MWMQRPWYLFSIIVIIFAGIYFLTNREPDSKAREIPKTEKNIEGLMSEEDIKKFGEFLGTEFKIEAYRITDTQTGAMVPMVYVATIPSMKKGINYNVRFWNHHEGTYLEAQDRVGMYVWVDGILGGSLSAEVQKVTKYEFDRIWLKFDSADGQAIVITKWHPSDKNYKWITNKVDGFSIQVSPAKYFN